MPHYDALVLTLCINNLDVHRVLIDPGSAADLLQLPAFKQMKLSLGVVNSIGRILSGFNGATTVTLGDIALLVKAEASDSAGYVLNRRRLGALQRHNGASLAALDESYPLNLHQMISYLTNVGQVDLLSSQLAARQCYQLSMQEQRGEKNAENPSLEDQTPV